MMTLYGYWRSSASYRVRIALALKSVDVNHVSINLRASEQSKAAHTSRNPQGFVPVLELEDGTTLRQSLAIIEYLDAAYPKPALIPSDPVIAAQLKAAALVIAADIAPIQNLSVLNQIRSEFKANDDQVKAWASHWITKGFTALEILAQEMSGEEGKTPFFMTQTPSLFECCLIPQIYNANRFGVDMSAFPHLTAIDAACAALPAFIAAHPSQQADAP